MGRLIRRLRNTLRARVIAMPIKRALLVYTIQAVLLALVLSLLAIGLFSSLQSDIYTNVYILFESDGALHTDGLSIYEHFTQDDQWWWSFYSYCLLISPVICSLLALSWGGRKFYKRKLKLPLEILIDSTQRIAHNDLDFKVCYPISDEMGALCSAFESMRVALEENNRQMWRMNEERKRLNAAFAHDLRTPITVLKGYLEFLTAYVPGERVDQKKLTDTLSTLSQQVGRIEGYVEAMSTVQKLEDISLVPKNVRANELFGHLAEEASLLCGRAHKAIRLTLDKSPLLLPLDSALITRVMENLMSNALRYAQTTVFFEAAADRSGITLTLSDDGRGFSPEELKKAADPFFKDAEASSEHFGLGLNICKVLCEKHNGTLILSNRPQGGARITARFGKLEFAPAA